MLLGELLSALGISTRICDEMGLHENVWVSVKPMTEDILNDSPVSMVNIGDTFVKVRKKNFYIIDKFSSTAKEVSGRVSSSITEKSYALIMVDIDIDIDLRNQKNRCSYDVVWFDIEGVVRVKRSLWLLNKFVEMVSS